MGKKKRKERKVLSKRKKKTRPRGVSWVAASSGLCCCFGGQVCIDLDYYCASGDEEIKLHNERIRGPKD